MDDIEDSGVSGDAQVTREHIEHSVKDWAERLEQLFQTVRVWASQNGWSVTDAGPVHMDEELMQKFRVPARDLPTLKAEGPNGTYALLKPKALWVIGANGRIDLYTSKGAFILVDQAKRFDAPDWRIFRADTKREGRSFDPSLLVELA